MTVTSYPYATSLIVLNNVRVQILKRLDTMDFVN